MIRHSSAFDTNSELLVQRFGQGITLIKPGSQAGRSSNSISSIYSLALSSYFVKCDNQRFTDVNETCLEVVCLQSHSDIIGKPAEYRSNPELAAQVTANNNTVISTKRMIVVEECGNRFDDYLIQALTFKFPWYFNNKVVGLFGCSILTNKLSMSQIAQIISSLISTGLLSPEQSLPMTIFPNMLCSNIYLSKRENMIASHLIGGKTAKEIGHHLCISKRTVEHHIQNIKLKLNVNSRSELIDKLLS